MTEPDKASIAIGMLQAQVSELSEQFDELKAETTKEQRKVHDIVVSTSESIRNLARTVDEMKPLTEDYREKRAEARGAARLAGWLYTAAGVVGGAVFFVASRVAEWLAMKPPLK